MEVIFFTGFSKRKNSTKRPNDADGIVRTVTLKGQCDLMNPMFFLKDVRPYTYCKAWGNYYFIHRTGHDIDGAEYVYCNIDVLATWKNQILNTSAYVQYSTNAFNKLLRDDRVGTLFKTVVFHQLEQSSLFFSSSSEPILLTTINDRGGVHTYVLEEDEYDFVCSRLMEAADDVIESLFQRFGDAINSVISVKRTPIPKSAMNTHTAPLVLGTYEIDPEYEWVDTLDDAHLEEFIEIAIPWHYDDFRNQEPYSFLSLALPFIGEVSLNASDFIDTNIIKIRTDVDCRTGVVVYTVYSWVISEPVATFTAQIGADLPIATSQLQAGLNYLSSAITVAKGAAIASTSGINPVSVGMGISGAVSAISAFNQHSTERTGSFTGGYPEFANNDYIAIVRYHETVEEPNKLAQLYGRPCGQIKQISELTGYVETKGFSIEVDALDSVRDMINSAMDSGVYLE